MVKFRLATFLVFVFGLIEGPAVAKPFYPNPEIFARAEDRERARMVDVLCNESDVGRGCFRYDGRLLRDTPCSYREKGIDAWGSLPTDQCYVMEAPRLYRGVWINEFEGQEFIPSGTKKPKVPGAGSGPAEWNKYIAATIWLDVGPAKLDRKWHYVDKALIEFVGRKTKHSGNYGHMGMSGNEVIVDRVISIRKCPKNGVCG